MPFDPYAMAREHGDATTLRKWEGLADFIDTDIVLTFTYSPFLQHERPTERDEYGPTHDVWVDSTRQVVTIFHEAISQTLDGLPNSPAVERESYVPPQLYGRGGAISFPLELVHVVVDNTWLMGVGGGGVANLLYDTMKTAYRSLDTWFDDHGVPDSDRGLPSLSPLVVLSIAQSHAQEFFPRLSPGMATIIPNRPLDANYPVAHVQFLVVVPYEKGNIIYFVDNQLNLASLIRTYPRGFVHLRSEGWPKD